MQSNIRFAPVIKVAPAIARPRPFLRLAPKVSPAFARLGRMGITSLAAQKIAAAAARREARDPKLHHAMVARLVALDVAALWRVVAAILSAVVGVDDTGPPHALRATRTLTAAPGAPSATRGVPVLA